MSFCHDMTSDAPKINKVICSFLWGKWSPERIGVLAPWSVHVDVFRPFGQMSNVPYRNLQLRNVPRRHWRAKEQMTKLFFIIPSARERLGGVAWTRSQERASFPGDRCLFVLTVTHAANANRGFFLPLCLYFITLLFDSNIFCYFEKCNHWSIHYVSYVVLLHSSAEKGGGFAAVKTNSLRFLRTFLLRTARQIFRFPIHLSVRLRQGDANAMA